MRHVLILLAVVVGLAACESTYEAPEPTGLGFNVAYIDTAVRPQDDLYRHVNGAWLDTVQIPPDRSAQGSFYEVNDSIEVQLKDIIQFASTAEFRPQGSDEQKVGDFFRSYMDSTSVDAARSDTAADRVRCNRPNR